jgi:hypothetical protein
MQTQGYSERTYKQLFGIKKAKDIEFADDLVGALGRIDRALLPPAATHPLAGLIAAGLSSVEQLVDIIDAGEEQNQLDAIDAIAHILLYAPAPDAVVKRLRSRLHKAGVAEQNPDKVALLAKCLALGKDEELLRHQLLLLGDEDPGLVASAARLLGLGGYVPAVPALVALLSPDRLFESRMVIWALGEIGAVEALPQLEYALGSAFRTVDCLIAMGKIGSLTSLPMLTPMIVSGLPEQRDAAYRALAMILDKNRASLASLAPMPEELARLVLHQLSDADLELSGATRFHMCLCLARLGMRLDTARVRRFLRLHLEEGEATKMASFFMRKEQ